MPLEGELGGDATIALEAVAAVERVERVDRDQQAGRLELESKTQRVGRCGDVFSRRRLLLDARPALCEGRQWSAVHDQ